MEYSWTKDPLMDQERLQKALEMATIAHAPQIRKSGEPYIMHPIAVAELIHEIGGDEDMVIAALLHDVLEDAGDRDLYSTKIHSTFGKHVFYMVDALSKDENIACTTLRQKDFFSQFESAISEDVGVFFIKIADLLHNLSTIEGLKPEKKQRWIKELTEGYMPMLSENFHRMTTHYREMYHRIMDRLEQTLTLTLS